MPIILTYHKISYHKDLGLNTITPEIFEKQIQIILSTGFIPVTFKQLEKNKIDKPLIITFDDGYESIYSQALPILKKYRIPAVIFIVSDYIGKTNAWESFPRQRSSQHLSKNQLLELQDNGCEIGSHSRFHNYLPTVSNDLLVQEVKYSKSMIEQMCESEVISFCYPYGQYSERVVHAVRDAGYRYAACNISLPQRNSGNLTLLRRSIYRNDNYSSFKKKLTGNNGMINRSILQEWLIQRGTIPGIAINIIQNLKF
jgi:peptidoglycan/xylan/chitin deacetylase (PgdA/CDA1 family)